MPLLRVEGVVARYGDVDILQGVSLVVEAESLVTLLGPNGAGKSTLLKTIIGLLHPRAGRVWFDGRETTRTSAEVNVETGMGYVPQVANVFPSLTVRENLEVSLLRGKAGDGVGEALDWFPALRGKLGLRAGVLSGGERQMLAIARALVIRPKLLLVDEPTAALAPVVARDIMDRILRIRGGGTAILMVEQNARLALTVADRGYVLEMGRNALDGTGQGLLDDPQVRDLYLGGGTGWADASD